MENDPELKRVVATVGLQMYEEDLDTLVKVLYETASRAEKLVSKMCSDLVLLQNKTEDTTSQVFVSAVQARSEISQFTTLLSGLYSRASEEK
ncbi:hypothetical protein FHR92_003018 [Fontibacillus solani]|uniref:Uncharacterized protein n=1 Tax=Fontibacillus solani TaxID=1572857 RepID=A0A7W3XSH4_9BACL|nr:hypothetical protein [Fontibacillus solani]MBA9086540.1 hypothetical protein [Fontibacillus solani]